MIFYDWEAHVFTKSLSASHSSAFRMHILPWRSIALSIFISASAGFKRASPL